MRFSRVFAAAAVVWGVAALHTLGAQQPTPPAKSAAPAAKAEAGIPIPDARVQKACGPCHTVDDKQQISRLSFQRNTPEGWQDAIRRMVALNGLAIDPDTAREVVKYLSNHLGLAPEEARPAAWEVERRLVDYTYEANADTNDVCNRCHSLGRVISQRRTREEWNLLIAMHRGWYPLVDNQAFRRGGPPPRDTSPDGRPPDTRHPVEKAVDHLAGAFPLKTAEWAAWSATMRPARLDGTWAVRARELGKGPVFGQMVITAVPGTTDEFTTRTTLIEAATGTAIERTGRTLIYTGFQWRGRSTAGADDSTALREVMFVDRDWQTIEGRWFTGGYDELGLDVTLHRLGPAPTVVGVSRTALRAGATGQALTIYGANLPDGLQPADLDLGPGIRVTRIGAAGRDRVTATVDVDATAAVGLRDLFLRGASHPRAVAVHDSVDTLKVSPAWGMARVGGIVFPKGLAQFEARAFDDGPDGKPGTADDIDLGLVPVTWSLEEYAATYDDDDVKFVGEIDARSGRFTPNVDGPNPERSGQRNNIGDVYAVATFTPEAADGKTASPLRARAHLLVTVPLYIRWEPYRGR